MSDSRAPRVGLGFDSHPFAPGRTLWLGGVEIPGAPGLRGHSDADVVLHALCDAVLGALGEDDIGTLFPNDDERHRDRASADFAAEAVCRARSRGYRVGNLDVVVIADRPRLSSHRAAMRARIGEIFELAGGAADVNIKGKTTEGLAVSDGIACHAIALLIADTNGGSGPKR